jgi:hypothetical protein
MGDEQERFDRVVVSIQAGKVLLRFGEYKLSMPADTALEIGRELANAGVRVISGRLEHVGRVVGDADA